MEYSTAGLFVGTPRLLAKLLRTLSSECNFAIHAFFNFKMMLACDMGSAIRQASPRAFLRRKAQIHRSSWDQLRPKGRNVPVRSSA